MSMSNKNPIAASQQEYLSKYAHIWYYMYQLGRNALFCLRRHFPRGVTRLAEEFLLPHMYLNSHVRYEELWNHSLGTEKSLVHGSFSNPSICLSFAQEWYEMAMLVKLLLKIY